MSTNPYLYTVTSREEFFTTRFSGAHKSGDKQLKIDISDYRVLFYNEGIAYAETFGTATLAIDAYNRIKKEFM